jgi:hypothetical protein
MRRIEVRIAMPLHVLSAKLPLRNGIGGKASMGEFSYGCFKR